jgi:hypothetical protein
VTNQIDNSYSSEGQPPRRFYLERMKDETGVSRTGRVLEGVVWQNGEVTVQWRPPHSTMGFYHSMAEFLLIHVYCHPSCNVVRWLDPSEGWHCFDCGASGLMGNFCQVCGSPSTGYHPTTEGWKSTERYEIERELEQLQRRRKELIEQLTKLPAEGQ